MLTRFLRRTAFDRFGRKPLISVVVVVYNIPRQARRTLLSLSARYQQHIGRDDYEVIVVDNGSTPPVDPAELRALDGQFRLLRVDPAPPSPAHAINRGLEAARGDVISVMIDGARLVTPGLLHFAYHGAQLYERSVVATLGWYLGADLQRWSMEAGHDAAYDERLLDSIEWPADGYRLFDIATMDESSIDGWVQPIAESNALFLRREMWDAIGRFDERFDMPGGGCLNLHVLRQALEHPGARLVILAGEGTFHQFHGGVATNAPEEVFAKRATSWLTQYEGLTHRTWAPAIPHDPPTYIGVVPRPALAHLVRATVRPVTGNRAKLPDLDGPVSDDAARFVDASIAALIDLAENEFQAGRLDCAAAVARLVRSRAPENRRLQRVLSVAGPALSHWSRSAHGGREPRPINVQPPGLTVIVDPSPVLGTPLRTNTHVFAEASERFFTERRLAALLNGQRVDLAVVNSPRRFEQALSDVLSLAKYLSLRSVVLISGTLPLDEVTQRSTREAGFHTGDLWKIVLCLKTLRPDLEMFTIATPPSGLTVIAGLGARPAALDASYHDVVARYREFPYHELRGREAELLNVVANDPQLVEALLHAYRGHPNVLEVV